MDDGKNNGNDGGSMEDDLFYFESDHLALRGNKDYSEALKTLVILESIREKSVKDYDEVVKMQNEMLEDPTPFITKLINNESLGIPDLYKVPEVPKVDWTKFNIPIPEQFFKALNVETVTNTPTKVKTEDIRPKHSSNTHNRPWTAEEQKKLEELLLMFPPEDVERRRFQKIAAALGNRTVKQVSSRVQKYFQKLFKAGLPIPGRIPKSLHDKKKPHKHQRMNHFFQKPSTFFPEFNIPVVMNEEDAPGPSQSSIESSSEYSASCSQQNYLIPNNYHETCSNNFSDKSDDELRLEILKKVKSEKQRQEECHEAPFHHIGFKCDYCAEEPIVGSRWHCSTCINDSIDFCTDCIVSQMYSTSSHPLKHQLLVIRNNNWNLEPVYSDYSDDDSTSDEQVKDKEDSDNEEDSDLDTFRACETKIKFEPQPSTSKMSSIL